MITCEFLDNDICRKASIEAGFEVHTFPKSCEACLSGKEVIRGLVTLEKYNRGDTNLAATGGPGTELQKIISWLPVPRKKGCASCIRMVTRMNRWGPDGCKSKMDYILKKLEIAAKRRGIPFSKNLTEKLVLKAIKKAEPK